MPNRIWPGLIKTALGLALLAALLAWGRIDVQALHGLTDAPAVVALCILLTIATLPIAALRWGVVLRTFGISIRYGTLFHLVGIGLATNLFVPGTVVGDAARGVYAWRAVGSGSARIAASVVLDRLIGLFALITIALMVATLNWNQIKHVPVLAALAVSTFAAFAAFVAAAAAVLLGYGLMTRIERVVARWPRLVDLVRHARDLALLIRTSPLPLAAAFGLSVLVHACTLAAVVLIAVTMNIGQLGVADYVFATPLTLVANAVPLTPNGIGVGEAAFDQICRWLESARSGAAYSSIFFAFRAISALACLPGLVSFVVYRRRGSEERAS